MNERHESQIEQRILNPPSGLLVLAILIILCLAVPVLFIGGIIALNSWEGGG